MLLVKPFHVNLYEFVIYKVIFHFKQLIYQSLYFLMIICLKLFAY